MKNLLIITTILILGCSDSQTSNQDYISPDEAIALATQANVHGFGGSQPPKVELNGDTYVVAFPRDMRVPISMSKRSDFSVKVWVDAKSGEIIRIALGD